MGDSNTKIIGWDKVLRKSISSTSRRLDSEKWLSKADNSLTSQNRSIMLLAHLKYFDLFTSSALFEASHKIPIFFITIEDFLFVALQESATVALTTKSQVPHSSIFFGVSFSLETVSVSRKKGVLTMRIDEKRLKLSLPGPHLKKSRRTRRPWGLYGS